MISFKFERVRWGYEGRISEEGVSLTSIEVTEGEDTVIIPESYEGEPVSFIGFSQRFTPAHLHWHDWHHPAQGADWEPDHYGYNYLTLSIPPSVRRLVIPSTVSKIYSSAFDKCEGVTIEIDPNNPTYTVRDNRPEYKR